MATQRSNCKEVTYVSSDFIFDFECTVCAKSGAMKEAVLFCIECQEYLCSLCADYHKRLPLTAAHTLSKRLHNPPKDDRHCGRVFIAIPTERCAKHSAEVIKMYCGLHDQVICVVCSTNDHKSCGDDVQYIPDVVDKLYKQQMTTDTKAALTKASVQMEHILTMVTKATNELKTAKLKALDAMKKFRTELNQILDQLEKVSTAELDKQCHALETKWQLQMQRAAETIKELEVRIHHLTNTSSNKSQQFVLMKMSQETISSAENINIQLLPCSFQISFLENVAIKRCLDKLSSLGKLSMNVQQVKLCLYTVKQSCKYNVKIKSDSKVCDIEGSCALDSGALLLADWKNKKLKLFDQNKNAVTSYCSLPSNPRAVCTVSDVEAAVSLKNNNTIQFVSIADKLIPTRKLTMNHDCFGLAAACGNMYISAFKGSSVYVHTLDGKLLQEIKEHKERSVQHIFSDTRHMALTENDTPHMAVTDNKIHVGDIHKGLITLDLQGNVLWQYCESDLKNAWGVCTDGYGNVFVCGIDSHNVIQLGHNGQKYGEILTRSHGLNGPTSVCFDKKNNQLIVANASDNNIQAFSLE